MKIERQKKTMNCFKVKVKQKLGISKLTIFYFILMKFERSFVFDF